jgi:peptide-methionine (S)-S-oxide reductase
VKYTLVGYTGGTVENPSYEDITTGRTGHAEALEVYYDPKETSYEELLRFFLTKAHNPTQLNGQGVDIGTQYRSAIFYDSEEQKQKAQSIINEVNKSGQYDKAIVTTLEPLKTFFVAEEYHQQFYEKYEAARGQPHIRVLYKLKNKSH